MTTNIRDDIFRLRHKLCDRVEGSAKWRRKRGIPPKSHPFHDSVLADIDAMLMRDETQDDYVERKVAEAVAPYKRREEASAKHVGLILDSLEKMISDHLLENREENVTYSAGSNSIGSNMCEAPKTIEEKVRPISYMIFKRKNASFWHISFKMSDGTTRTRTSGVLAYEDQAQAWSQARAIFDTL